MLSARQNENIATTAFIVAYIFAMTGMMTVTKWLVYAGAAMLAASHRVRIKCRV